MPRTHMYSSYNAIRALERLAAHNGSPVDHDPDVFSSIVETLILKANQDLLAVESGTADERPLLTVGQFKQLLEKMKDPIRKKHDPGILEAVTLLEEPKSEVGPTPASA